MTDNPTSTTALDSDNSRLLNRLDLLTHTITSDAPSSADVPVTNAAAWSRAQADVLDQWPTLDFQETRELVRLTYDFATHGRADRTDLDPGSAQYNAIRRLVTVASNNGGLDYIRAESQLVRPIIDAIRNAVTYRASGTTAHQQIAKDAVDVLWNQRSPEFVGVALSARFVNNQDTLDVANHLGDLMIDERTDLLRQVITTSADDPVRDASHATIVCALLADLSGQRTGDVFATLFQLAESLNPEQWTQEVSSATLVAARGRIFDALLGFSGGTSDYEVTMQRALNDKLFDVAPSHWASRATGHGLDVLIESRSHLRARVFQKLTGVAFRGDQHTERVASLVTQSCQGLEALTFDGNVQLLALSLPHLNADRAVEVLGRDALTLADAAANLIRVVDATHAAGNRVPGSEFAAYSPATSRGVVAFGLRVIELVGTDGDRQNRLKAKLSTITAYVSSFEALRETLDVSRSISLGTQLSNEFDFASRNLPCD
jgi:hypothetical protein